MSKPHIVSFESYSEWDSVPMNERFEVHPMPDNGAADIPEDIRNKVEAFAFKGHSAMDASIMDQFPNLRLIANFGVGYDTIDVAHATSRGIKVTNTPDVLTDDVADLAVGMLIACSRDIIGASNWVTSGNWATAGAHSLQTKVSGKTVGIAGLGRIGRSIAERMQAFKCDISYYSRSEKDTPGWKHIDNVVDLASAVDFLVVSVSAGPETTKIISKEVLKALGSDGMLINISRGVTVDEEALIEALQQRTIKSAALDVFYNEPTIDERFMQLDNVLLQPHQSSATTETRKQMGQLQRDNLEAFFDGKPLLTPVV